MAKKIAKKLLIGLLGFLFCIFLAGLLAELVLRKKSNIVWKDPKVHQADPELGYSGRPNVSGMNTLWYGPNKVFEAEIRLDEHAFREVPGRLKERSSRCVALIGDSNAFGIGMEADKIVSGLLQKNLKARVFNFGYSGYGPHQNLRFLEIGREKQILSSCKELYVYHFAMLDHVQRVAGRIPWGLSAPKYVLENGQLLHKGFFWPEWANRINNELQNYQIGRPLMMFLTGYHRPISQADRELYKAVIRRMKQIFLERYQAKFTVVYVGRGMVVDAAVRALEAPEVDIRYVEELAVAAGRGKDIINEFYLKDYTHLNEAGHQLVADSILKDLEGWRR